MTIGKEPDITINGITLSAGQAMAVRVACSNMDAEFKADEEVLGSDDEGHELREVYMQRIVEVLSYMRVDPV